MARQYNALEWGNSYFIGALVSVCIFLLTLLYFYVKRTVGPNAQRVVERVDKTTIYMQCATGFIIFTLVISALWSNVFYIKFYSGFLVTLGLLLMYISDILLIWTLYYLGKNWTMLVSKVENHELVTTGPYKFARHPMYTCLWIWSVGWFCFFGGWLVFISFIIKFLIASSRIKQEEILLIDQFGHEYINYMSNTGAFCPCTMCGDCGVDYNQERLHLLANRPPVESIDSNKTIPNQNSSNNPQKIENKEPQLLQNNDVLQENVDQDDKL